MKILHVVGGPPLNGAYKGAFILHEALIDQNIDSFILNDCPQYAKTKDKNIYYINENIYKKFLNFIYVFVEKLIKSILLKTPRSTFTIGFLGFDITKIPQYKDADIIHIHWLSQGFIRLESLKKIKKPIVWTMRDMWPFTGGPHYTVDFEGYENKFLSKFIKAYKKKTYKKNIQFIAISNWLKLQAEKSNVLSNFEIQKIYNNVDIKNFKLLDKKHAMSSLKIKTDKKIILFGAQNPQSKRKGWNILVDTLKKVDTSKYFLLLFGSFWSHETLNKIGIEYLSLGFLDDKKKLNAAYCSSDFFLFPSIQEAFGKTCIEAMACGIPVICFRDTSISELINHETDGYIVDNINSNDLKTGIEWMEKRVDENHFLNETVRKKVSNFSAKSIAKQYMNLYSSLLK
tara:strand:+ start:31768 stop:32967 length:1200 start_codon:yes stop_codon:yes gene_type:complete